MLIRNRWFESVAVARRRAERRLPRSVAGALRAGTERGVSATDNTVAFDEVLLRPALADRPAERVMTGAVMDQPMTMPVLISPTGVQAVHPEGELAVARAAAARGVAVGLSAFASKPLPAVVDANPQTFFQIYWAGGRDAILAAMARAKVAGAVGLILTLDWSFSHSRDWGSPPIPDRIDLRTMLRHLPELVVRPAWVAQWVRAGGPPDLGVPNFELEGGRIPTFFEAYGTWMQTPPPSWDDVAWLRSQWDGPFMLKGVMNPDDGRRAVEAGVSAISVSNHGGNDVDSAPAPLRMLPAIVDAVGGDVEVIMDGGVRRGSDVVKARALGAKAVMIGRAALWGLAANGQAGVENVLDILRDGIDSTMLALGVAAIDDIDRSHVFVPPGFSPLDWGRRA